MADSTSIVTCEKNFFPSASSPFASCACVRACAAGVMNGWLPRTRAFNRALVHSTHPVLHLNPLALLWCHLQDLGWKVSNVKFFCCNAQLCPACNYCKQRHSKCHKCKRRVKQIARCSLFYQQGDCDERATSGNAAYVMTPPFHFVFC